MQYKAENSQYTQNIQTQALIIKSYCVKAVLNVYEDQEEDVTK